MQLKNIQILIICTKILQNFINVNLNKSKIKENSQEKRRKETMYQVNYRY